MRVSVRKCEREHECRSVSVILRVCVCECESVRV